MVTSYVLLDIKTVSNNCTSDVWLLQGSKAVNMAYSGGHQAAFELLQGFMPGDQVLLSG